MLQRKNCERAAYRKMEAAHGGMGGAERARASLLSFFRVRSAGEEKIKVETMLLKLGNVEEAAATYMNRRAHTHTHTQ